jgi:hypothetical protein
MTLFFEEVEMNAAAVNLSMVSNGLLTSPFKSAEALSIESLNFFNQIFQLNCSLARESIDTQLACFGKILHENNLEKSNEVIVDHVKSIPKNVTGYMRDIAELSEKNTERVRQLADVGVADAMEGISELVEDMVRTAPSVSEPRIELLRANVAIFEVAYKKISTANEVVADNVYSQLKYYLDKLSSRKFQGSVDGDAQSSSQYDIDCQAETEGGSIE